MNAARQAGWAFCLLLALAGFGWYFASLPEANKLDEESLAKTPDAIFLKIKVREFDEKGELVHILESPEMQHIPEQDKNLFSSPHLIIKQDSFWDIRAASAIAFNKADEIQLIKDVIIHQDKKEQSATFKTQRLSYFPKLKFAMTKEPLRFEQEGKVVEAVGMKAYLNDKRVQLLNKARAVYVPVHS